MNINEKMIGLMAISLLLSACASNQTTIKPEAVANNSEQARIRLYGQNGKPTIMHYTFNGKKEKINVGGGASDAFGSLIGTAKSQGIGIPQTELSQNLKKQNGVLSKAIYKEFMIPSGTTLNIRNSLISMRTANANNTLVSYSPSCSSKTLQFKAQAGKDYEVASIVNNQGCAVVIFEIHPDGQTTVVQ